MRKVLISLFLCVSALAYAQKTYLVCVGVGKNNTGRNQLYGVANDVKAFAKFYNRYNGTHPFVLLDNNATRSNILKVLKREFSKSTSADEIIFAYSGHGYDGYITSYNFRDDEVVLFSEIQDIMLKAKARRRMMFIDACRSGSATETLRSNKYNKNSKVLLFLSSRNSESSLAGSAGEELSLFFHFLIKGLMGDADKSGDKKVTARELFNYVGYNVRYTSRYYRDSNNEGIEQHPVMWGKFPDDMVMVYVK